MSEPTRNFRYMVTDKFSLNDMFIDLTRPSELDADEGADVLAWLELVTRKIKRSIRVETVVTSGREKEE